MSSLPGCLRLLASSLPSALAGVAGTGFGSSFGPTTGSLADVEIGATAGAFSSIALLFLDLVNNICSEVSVVEDFVSTIDCLSSFFDLTTSATLRVALVDPDLATGFSFSFNSGNESLDSASSLFADLSWSRSLEAAPFDFFVGVSAMTSLSSLFDGDVALEAVLEGVAMAPGVPGRRGIAGTMWLEAALLKLALLEGREPIPSRSGKAVGIFVKPGGIVGVPRREATSLSRPGGIAGVDRRDSWNCGSDERLGLRDGVVNSFRGGKSASSAVSLSASFLQREVRELSVIQTPAAARLAAMTIRRRRHQAQQQQAKRLEKKGKL
jgi:hypothetical protein